MALRIPVRRNCDGKSSVSIKCHNLHSFKEGVILLCQSILDARRISRVHDSARFTIHLILEVKFGGDLFGSLNYCRRFDFLKAAHDAFLLN